MTITDAGEVRTRAQAWAVFISHTSPRLLALNVVALVSLRVRLFEYEGWAGASAWELVAIGLICLVLWPVQEWVLHQYVLHLRPRVLLGRRIDPYFAQRHRAHHREPRVIETTLLPPRTILALLGPNIALWWWLMPTPALALTSMAAYAGSALAYEWIHYLSHTSVPPRTKWFARVRRNHRYHHYKNERYWHAFTLPLVDSLFGTNPDPKSVETSETARTLGVDFAPE